MRPRSADISEDGPGVEAGQDVVDETARLALVRKCSATVRPVSATRRGRPAARSLAADKGAFRAFLEPMFLAGHVHLDIDIS